MSVRRIVLVALMALLAALPAVLPAAASAAPPEFFDIEIDEFGPDPRLSEFCGFAVSSGVEGTIKVSTRETRDGTIIELARIRLAVTYVNTETGETLRTPDVGVDKLTIFPDGTATVAIMGLAQRIVVPGEGVIAGSIGRLVLFFEGPDDEEPGVLFEKGPEFEFGFHIARAVCAALAP